MKQKVAAIIAQQGQSAIYPIIDKTVRDLKQAQYTKGEIKETIRECYFGIDGLVDNYIINKGY